MVSQSGAFNPWDSQSARVYPQSEPWHSLNANENGGQSRDAILAFAQNQRDEVRNLGDLAGSLAAEPGMKQQTFVAGFKAGQSADAGLGYETEKSPTLSATPSALEPTIVAVDVYNQTVDGAITATVTAAVGSSNTSGPKVLAVDCRNGTESKEVNGTLQAKSGGGTSLNLNNVIRVTE